MRTLCARGRIETSSAAAARGAKLRVASEKTTPLKPGTRVRVNSLEKTAVVEEGPNRKGMYLIALGAVTMWAPASDLQPLKPPKKTSRPSAQPTPSSGRETTLSIDLHGMNREEATVALEELLDQALRAGTDRLEVIHGIGSGAVKNIVHQYLGASRHVRSYRLDDTNPGTTWAYL